VCERVWECEKRSVYVFVCVFVCVCVYVCVYPHVYVYIHVCMCTLDIISTCTYFYIYNVHIYVYIHTRICTFIHMYTREHRAYMNYTNKYAYTLNHVYVYG